MGDPGWRGERGKEEEEAVQEILSSGGGEGELVYYQGGKVEAAEAVGGRGQEGKVLQMSENWS